MKQFSMYISSAMMMVRPESHDQVFLHNFLALIVWKVAQVYDGNFIAQLCENENQYLEQ